MLSWLFTFVIVVGGVGFAFRLRAEATGRSRALSPEDEPPTALRTGEQLRAFVILLGFMVPLAHLAFMALSVLGYRDRPEQLAWPSVVLCIVLVQLFRSFERPLARPSPMLVRAAVAAWVITVLFLWARLAGWLELPYAMRRQ